MNKKYFVIIVMTFLFSFVCLQGYSPARGEVITDTEKWQKIVESATRQNVPGTDLVKILNIVQHADAEDFPVDPLLNKALEGMAKRAPSSVIIKVLEAKIDGFHVCQKILNQIRDIEKESASQTEKSLIILSESLSRGVSEQELEALSRHAATPRSVNLANASQDLATFKGLGFSPADAMEIVRTGMEHGIYRKRSQGISTTVSKAREKGISDAQIKDIFLSNIKGGRGMDGILHGRQNQRQLRPSPIEKKGQSKGGPRFRSPR